MAHVVALEVAHAAGVYDAQGLVRRHALVDQAAAVAGQARGAEGGAGDEEQGERGDRPLAPQVGGEGDAGR